MSPGEIYALFLLGPLGHTLAIIATMALAGITPLQALALLTGLAIIDTATSSDIDEGD